MQLVKPDYLHLKLFKANTLIIRTSMKKLILQLICLFILTAIPQVFFGQSTRATFGFSYVMKQNNTDKYLEILEVLENGDAMAKGLKSGDLIEEIEGQKVEGLYDSKITEIIIAAKGNKKLSVKRKGDNKLTQLVLKEIPTYICKSKNCTEGKVKVLNVFNLNLYEGDFKNGNYNGTGTITFTGASKNYPPYHFIKQTGTFVKGVFVKGVTEYLYGKFEGNTYNGVPEGEGIYTDIKGAIYKGKFVNGTFYDGILITKNNQGKIIETKYVNGRPAK